MTTFDVQPIVASEQILQQEIDLVVFKSGWEDTELFWQSGSSYLDDDGVEYCVIDSLEEGYEVTIPIPVRIERVDEHTYQAAFNEANIAISGDDPQDAYQSLVAEILDSYDILSAEPNLTGEAAAQLAVLRRHIVKA